MIVKVTAVEAVKHSARIKLEGDVILHLSLIKMCFLLAEQSVPYWLRKSLCLGAVRSISTNHLSFLPLHTQLHTHGRIRTFNQSSVNGRGMLKLYSIWT